MADNSTGPQVSGAPGPTNPRPPTSADVARLARVSRATVSLVLNDAPDSRVSEETRARVRAAAAELGYIPNAAASALRAGRSQLVLIPFNRLPYSQAQNTYYDHMAERLAELGYTVMFHKDRWGEGDEAARQWAALRPVAVLVEPQRLTEPAVELLRKAGVQAIVPLSMLAAASNMEAWLESVGVTAAEHLLAAGHQRLGVVVPRESSLAPLGLARLAGAERVTTAQGGTVERIDLALDAREAFVLAQRWRRSTHPSGVLAYNDEYALLLMRALLDSGLAIPGDVAIVGCDNLPIGEFVRPRLTSIWPVPDAAGRAMADRIHELITGQPPAVERPGLKATIVIRESG